MAPLPVLHRCTHRLYTLATTHRAFTMGVNKPYSSCFTFKHSKHAALTELVFILCSVNPTPTSDSVGKDFRVHSEHCMPFSSQQYSHTQLVRQCGNYLLDWYSQKFYFMGFCQSLSSTVLHQKPKISVEVFICWISVEINFTESAHGLLFYLK